MTQLRRISVSDPFDFLDSFGSTDTLGESLVFGKPKSKKGCRFSERSNISNRSKYTSNNKLIKSRLYEALRKGNDSKKLTLNDERLTEVHLLEDSLNILDKGRI